jgi:hypothetical protein
MNFASSPHNLEWILKYGNLFVALSGHGRVIFIYYWHNITRNGELGPRQKLRRNRGKHEQNTNNRSVRRDPLARGGRRPRAGLLVEHEVAEDAEDAEPDERHLARPERQPAALVQHLPAGAPAGRRAHGRLHAHLLRAHLVRVGVAPPLLCAAPRYACVLLARWCVGCVCELPLRSAGGRGVRDWLCKARGEAV